MRKGIYRLILTVLLIFVGGRTGLEASHIPDGEDIEHNEQNVDSFTGQVYSDDNTVLSEEVMISENCIYNRTTQMFSYWLEGKTEPYFGSSAADGMVTNEPVILDIDSSIPCSIYRDGEPVEIAELPEGICDAGSYVLLIDGKQVLSFTIIGEYTRLSRFAVPDGFSITYASHEGKEMEYQQGVVPMKEDGKYEVYYECAKTGVAYSFVTTVDHTPPVLALEAVEENGRAHGPVDISDVEEGGTITVMLEGEVIDTKTVLTQSGSYSVIVSDTAGNSSVYNFTIMIYFNIGSMIFFLLLLAVAAGVAVYIVISRKKLRVF